MKVKENTGFDLSGSDEKKKIWIKPIVEVISQNLIQGGTVTNKVEGTSSSGLPAVS